MWGDHLCPRTTGQAPCPPPTTKVGGCSWERRGEGAPPNMNIYNGSGLLLHPPAPWKPPQPASLGESPQALKVFLIGPLSSQPIECQMKPFFSCLKPFFLVKRPARTTAFLRTNLSLCEGLLSTQISASFLSSICFYKFHRGSKSLSGHQLGNKRRHRCLYICTDQ